MAKDNFTVVMHKDVDPTTVAEWKVSDKIYATEAQTDFEKYIKEGYTCIHIETHGISYVSHFVKFKETKKE